MAILKIGRVRMGLKGTWSADTAYEALDAVFYEGQTYVATQTVPVSTVTTNTSFWQLIAQKGADGVDGAPGTDGIDGETGPIGVGETGPQGDTGNTGPQGNIGETGATGVTGLQGIEGPQGSTGTTGVTGSQGPTGFTGPAGPVGEGGSAGSLTIGYVYTGASGSAVSIVNTGSTSVAVLDITIPQGTTGPIGATGPVGPSGAANQTLETSSSVTFAGVAVNGEITATGNITAYYSDDRLKTRTGYIENALDKVKTLDAFYYHANDVAQALGYESVPEVGISAQQVFAVMPQVTAPAPIDPQYLTVRYERLVPLLIAAIQELEIRVAAYESK